MRQWAKSANETLDRITVDFREPQMSYIGMRGLRILGFLTLFWQLHVKAHRCPIFPRKPGSCSFNFVSEYRPEEKVLSKFQSLSTTFKKLFYQRNTYVYWIKEPNKILLKGTVAWDFWTLVFLWINRYKDMIKLQIYHFPFFGEFAELLANPNLLAALLNTAIKFFFS